MEPHYVTLPLLRSILYSVLELHHPPHLKVSLELQSVGSRLPADLVLKEFVLSMSFRALGDQMGCDGNIKGVSFPHWEYGRFPKDTN